MTVVDRSRGSLAVLLGAVALSLVAPSCGGDDDDTMTTGGKAGSANKGGTGGVSAGSGGTTASGGSGNTTGGAMSTGGNESTGGSTPNGGNSSTGGAASGGDAPTGGKAATGGNAPTGGSKATGGSNATGGTQAMAGEGGMGVEGGMGGEGGAIVVEGGATSTGGAGPEGGATATGGAGGAGPEGGAGGTGGGEVNLIPDGTFETGKGAWGGWENGTVDVSTVRAHSGTASLRGGPMTGGAVGRDIMALVAPGKKYKATAWVNIDVTEGSAQVMFQTVRNCNSESDSYPWYMGPTITNDTWVELTGTVDLSTCTTINKMILFVGGASAGYMYLDDVSLTEIP